MAVKKSKSKQTMGKRGQKTTAFLESLEEIESAPRRPFVQTEASNSDSRVFEYTHTGQSMADHAALGYFQINEPSLLRCDILKTGRKKFLFFGSSEKTFRYTLRPIFKKLVIPFLQEIFKLADLNLYAHIISINAHVVKIRFSGADLERFSKNQQENIHAFETIIKIYIARKVFLSKNTTFQIEFNQNNTSHKKKSFNKRQNQNRNRNDTPSTITSEKDLIDRVENIKREILSTKRPQVLKFLNPSQRRAIHLHIDGDSRFETRSLGEGHYKRIEIDLK